MCKEGRSPVWKEMWTWQSWLCKHPGFTTKVCCTSRLRTHSWLPSKPNSRVACCPIYTLTSWVRLVTDFASFPLTRRRGVILIASEACLRGFRNPWWKDFIEYLRDRKLVNNHLEIFCARHGVQQNVCNRADLKSMSPHGGCTGFCGEMACGHLCPSVCHPLDNTWSALRCRQPCSRVCRGGHQCSNQCWEPCGKCYHVISVSYECEHASVSQKQIFCHEVS